jgi:hypothetical protein
MREHYDVTNSIYYRKQRTSIIRELTGVILMILAIGIPFSIYFWRY